MYRDLKFCICFDENMKKNLPSKEKIEFESFLELFYNLLACQVFFDAIITVAFSSLSIPLLMLLPIMNCKLAMGS